MLFVGMLTLKQGLTREQRAAAAQRRVRWKPPPSINLIAEYWLLGPSQIVTVFETENSGAILSLQAHWDDLFDIQVFPAISEEQGLRVLQQAGLVRRRGRPPKPRPELTPQQK